MQTTKYIWKNGKAIPWADATTHVLSHGLHYGSAVFEGIRFYKTAKGPAIFKLQEHVERFFYSAKQLAMKIPYTQQEICDAITATVRDNEIEAGYIRPLAYYGYGDIRVAPSKDMPVDVIVAVWPWGDYLPVKAVDITISPYIRIHPKSTVADAKISGHYVNSIIAGLAIRDTHYHEVILLDADGYVAEGSAENIFIVKNNEIFTTPAGTILVGITRNTVIEIAKEFGFKVTEKSFKPEDIQNADEAFFTGTAVEVTAIGSLDDKKIGEHVIGPITQQIAKRYQQMVHGEYSSDANALTQVRDESKQEVETII